MVSAPVPGGSKEPVSITVVADGVPFTFRPAEINAKLSGEFRRATQGMTVRQVLNMASEDADLDVMGGLIWLARKQSGEADADYDAVLEGLTYETKFDVSRSKDDEAAEDPDSPEP